MASSSGFSVTPSAAFKRVSVAAVHLDIAEVARSATLSVAAHTVKPLRAAAKAAGASKETVDSIAVSVVSNDNDLVMRQRPDIGDITVGVSGHAPGAEEADDLEWGSMEQTPRAWVQGYHAHNESSVYESWSHELTNELNRRLK